MATNQRRKKRRKGKRTPRARQEGYTPLTTNADTNADDGVWDTHDIEASDGEYEEIKEMVDDSKWKSQLFTVESGEVDVKNSWRHSDYYRYQIFHTTKWVVVPLYLSFGVAAVAMLILNVFHIITPNIGMAVILSLTLFGGGLGAVFVYRFGTVNDVIDFMKLQNQWYDASLSKLRDIRKEVSAEAKGVHFEVHKLKKTSADLAEQLKAFDELREELVGIVGSNEKMQEMVDTVNSICAETRLAMKRNERAHLLSIYYELVRRDEGDAEGKQQLNLTRRDYDRRFLSRLDKETRREIEMQGGFEGMDTNKDGTVDKEEFTRLIDTVLQIGEEEEFICDAQVTATHTLRRSS